MEFNLHALMEELMTFEKKLDDSKFYAKVVIFFVFCSFKSNALLTENQKDNLNLWLLAINCKLFSSWYYRAAYKTLSREGGGNLFCWTQYFCLYLILFSSQIYMYSHEFNQNFVNSVQCFLLLIHSSFLLSVIF